MALPHVGIYISWMLPVVISLPLVNLLIFGRLIPRHGRLVADRSPPTGRQVGRFLAGDFTGALCRASPRPPWCPLVAMRTLAGRLRVLLHRLDDRRVAIDLLAVNMATSLTVEGSFDAATLAVNCRAALRKAIFILVPIALGLALLASRVLALFGAGYSAPGALILELLAVATLPKTVTEIYVGALRAQSSTSVIAIVQGVAPSCCSVWRWC